MIVYLLLHLFGTALGGRTAVAPFMASKDFIAFAWLVQYSIFAA